MPRHVPPCACRSQCLSQARNLKRDLDTLDPAEELSVAAMGAAAALFARNPSAITKQVRFAASTMSASADGVNIFSFLRCMSAS